MMDEVNKKASMPTPQIKEKSQGSKMMLFIFGVVIILISVWAYMLGANKAQAPVANNTLPQPSVSPTDETTTWKTYTNSSFDLSFMHPLEVMIEENKDYKNNPRLYIHPSFYNTNKLSQDQHEKVFQIFITKRNNPQNLTASQIVANDIAGITKTKPSDPTLQEMQKVSRKAIKSYVIGQIEGVYTRFGEAHSIPNIYITQNDKLYIFTFNGDQGDEANPETQKLIDQILSTFQFSN